MQRVLATPAGSAAAPRGGDFDARAALGRMPPSGLFVLGAVTQYVGAAIAVLLFAVVAAGAVAWLRVLAAAVVLCAWRRPWEVRWTRETLALTAAFGVALAAMNACFYLAIDRLPLGTVVAIEFCGPVAVAALGSRTRRDAAALGLVVLGILLLADVHIAGEPGGVALAVGAGVFWALYVVLGHRIVLHEGASQQHALGLAMAIGAIGLAPLCVAASAPAFEHPHLLLACLGVGVMSSAIPYALEQLAMRRLPRARFALLLALLPATAALVGAVMLAQIPTWTELVGIALVVLAAGLRSHES